MTIQEYEICLSIQRALLDAVTKSLRRVSFISSENLITVYFFYDGEPSEIEKELVSDVACEIISDFPDRYKINCEIIRADYPSEIKSQGRIIFSRYANSIL